MESHDHDSLLRRLDETWVPRMRRVAHGVAGFLGAPGRGLRQAEESFLDGRVARFGDRNSQLVTLLIVVLILGAAAVNYQRFPALQQEAADRAEAAREQTVREPGSGLGGDTLAGGAVAVGPIIGTSVDLYLDGVDDALAEVDDDEERAAIVSFASFLTPDEVTDLLPDVTIDRVQYRLPLDGAAPGSTGGSSQGVREAEVIDSDLAASVATFLDVLLDDIVEEEAGLSEMLETTNDPDFRAEFETRLEELGQLRSTLASGGRILFAVVVTATGDDLRTIATDDEVRTVDVAPAGTDASASEFFGLLPTDTQRVTFGQFV